MKMNMNMKMEYQYGIYMHSHLVLNTTLGKWSEMDKWNGGWLPKPLTVLILTMDLLWMLTYVYWQLVGNLYIYISTIK